MLTSLLCKLIPTRHSYANSSLRCTKIEHAFLTVLKVRSTQKKENWQKPKWNFGKRKTETIKTDPHYNRSKYFLKVITSNQHLSFLGNCNNSLVSTIINSTTEPSGILIRLMHSQISCSEQNPSPQNMEGGTSSSWVRRGDGGILNDTLFTSPATLIPRSGTAIKPHKW